MRLLIPAPGVVLGPQRAYCWTDIYSKDSHWSWSPPTVFPEQVACVCCPGQQGEEPNLASADVSLLLPVTHLRTLCQVSIRNQSLGFKMFKNLMCVKLNHVKGHDPYFLLICTHKTYYITYFNPFIMFTYVKWKYKKMSCRKSINIQTTGS